MRYYSCISYTKTTTSSVTKSDALLMILYLEFSSILFGSLFLTNAPSCLARTPQSSELRVGQSCETEGLGGVVDVILAKGRDEEVGVIVSLSFPLAYVFFTYLWMLNGIGLLTS